MATPSAKSTLDVPSHGRPKETKCIPLAGHELKKHTELFWRFGFVFGVSWSWAAHGYDCSLSQAVSRTTRNSESNHFGNFLFLGMGRPK